MRLNSFQNFVPTGNSHARVRQAHCLETLVDSILEGREESFGFRNSYILVPTDQEGVLVTMATRGYAAGSVGAEVRYGEGIGGMVAEARKPIRISGLLRGMLYALAMHKAESEPQLTRLTRQIPVPGIPNPAQPAALIEKPPHTAV